MNGIQPFEIASVAVTFFTGVALIAFAYLTYRLSKKVTGIQYSPILDITPIKYPEVGEFNDSGNIYSGVKWEVCFTNPGSIPILARDITLIVIDASEEEGIGRKYLRKQFDLIDEDGKEYSRQAIDIDALSLKRVKIYLCREIKWYRMRFRPDDEVKFILSVSQTRGVNSASERIIEVKSEMFRFPKSLQVIPQSND